MDSRAGKKNRAQKTSGVLEGRTQVTGKEWEQGQRNGRTECRAKPWAKKSQGEDMSQEGQKAELVKQRAEWEATQNDWYYWNSSRER